LTFGLESIGEQGKVDRPCRAVNGSLLYRGKLIFVNAFGIVKEAADKRGFSIIDTSRRCKAKKLFMLFLLEELVNSGDGGGHF